MDGFEVQRKMSNDVVILHLKGYLDAHTAPQLEKALQTCIDQKEYKIIINFENLSYISSAGLGVFMGFIEEIRQHGGDLKFSNMNPKIFRVFDLLGFPNLFEIFDDERDALNKFNSK